MERRTVERLILIFNAESGALAAIVDSTKKLFMLKGCTLCSITHGILGEKSEWKSCKEEIGVPVDYLHRDEVPEPMRRTVGQRLPCIVAQVGREFILLLTPEILERCKGNVADLKGKIAYHAATKNLEIPAAAGGA